MVLKDLAPGLRGVMPLAVIVLALLLWWCTAMIYCLLKFIQEWATPLTFFNYLLIGMASGMSLYAALALLAGLGPNAYAAAAGRWASSPSSRSRCALPRWCATRGSTRSRRRSPPPACATRWSCSARWA